MELPSPSPFCSSLHLSPANNVLKVTQVLQDCSSEDVNWHSKFRFKVAWCWALQCTMILYIHSLLLRLWRMKVY